MEVGYERATRSLCITGGFPMCHNSAPFSPLLVEELKITTGNRTNEKKKDRRVYIYIYFFFKPTNQYI